MTKIEASKLMAMLVAAYPRGPWPDETRALHESELANLDAAFGAEAVQAAIRSCKFSPTIAELIELHNEARKESRRVELERADEAEARLLASKGKEIVAETRDRLRLLTKGIGRGAA